MTSLVAFYILAGLIVFLAVLAVSVGNLVRAALALAFCFFAVAGLFWVLGSPFVAVLQLVVNVGAIPIVTIFIVMMTRSRHARHQLYPLLFSIPVALLSFFSLRGLFQGLDQTEGVKAISTEHLGIELLSIRGRSVEASTGEFVVNAGTIVAFEVTALVLLVAFVGAIILAQRDGFESQAQPEVERVNA
ncbi:MAG: NADH-quinone oxidoreductase subunit J [Deinococcales bacterium]